MDMGLADHDDVRADPWGGGLGLEDPPAVDESEPSDVATPDESEPSDEVTSDEAPESPADWVMVPPTSPEMASHEVERLDTVEEITRAAAAEFSSPVAEDPGPWGDDAAAVAEAPVDTVDETVADGLEDDATGTMDLEVTSMEAELGVEDAEPAPGVMDPLPTTPVGAMDLEEAAAPAPPAATAEPPAEPPKFQFGKRDPQDKARRLARVLVSDIITYNPERHQRALEHGTLHSDFEDEIRKSWAEYVEQVGREIAESTPYWFDALNEILARGEAVF